MAFFSTSVSESSSSLISNTNLISKIYFPRLIIPASAIVVSFTDFIISCCFLVFIMLWYKFIPSWHIIFIPLFLFLALLTALSIGIWFVALNVKYRDFRYVIPFMIQFGLYISPVGFIGNIVSEKWRLLHSINPMVGIIDGFRWAVIGNVTALYFSGDYTIYNINNNINFGITIF